AADILVFTRVGRKLDGLGNACGVRCSCLILRVLLAADFSPVGVDFGIGQALQRILVREEVIVAVSATNNPHNRVYGLKPGGIGAVFAAMMMDLIEADWSREGRDAHCLDVAVF